MSLDELIAEAMATAAWQTGGRTMSLDELIAEAMATAARLNALCDKIEAREVVK